jgi:hypothetical protein
MKRELRTKMKYSLTSLFHCWTDTTRPEAAGAGM